MHAHTHTHTLNVFLQENPAENIAVLLHKANGPTSATFQDQARIKRALIFKKIIMILTFNFGHKFTTNESNANHLKSIFNKKSKLSSLSQLIIREIKLNCTYVKLSMLVKLNIDQSIPLTFVIR